MLAILLQPFARFFGKETPLPAPLLFSRKRVYILPTKAGLGFAFMLAIMFAGSINYNISLGYLLVFVLAAAAIISIFYTHRNLLGLEVSPGNIQPVFCGETASLVLIINNNAYQCRYSVHLSTNSNPSEGYDIPANKPTLANIAYKTKSRGQNRMPVITFETRFPFGLVRAWSYANFRHSFLVYPRPASPRPLPALHSHRQDQLGALGSGADDFIGMRVYRPGDSIANINWKALAREQGLLTNQFGGDQHQELWLDWRLLSDIPQEERISILCRWTISAETSALIYGLWVPGTVFNPSRGLHHYHQCLKTLALFAAKK